jgi:hypothetical protein
VTVESFSGIASAQPANITATTATALRHPVYSAIKDPRRCATRLTTSVISRCGHCKADLATAAFRHLATRGVHRYDNLLLSADKTVGLEPDAQRSQLGRRARSGKRCRMKRPLESRGRRRKLAGEACPSAPRPFFSRQSPTAPSSVRLDQIFRPTRGGTRGRCQHRPTAGLPPRGRVCGSLLNARVTSA